MSNSTTCACPPRLCSPRLRDAERPGRDRSGVRRGRRGLGVLAAVAGFAVLAAPKTAEAQLDRMFGGGRGLVIEGVTLKTGTGRTIENASLAVRRGQIARVWRTGEGEAPGGRNRVIDGAGLYVTPGLIDVHSYFGLTGGGGNGALNRASDAFDGHDRRALESAWSQGVTMVYVPARGGAISGTGSVMRLGETIEALEGGVALCLNIDSAGGAVARLNRIAGIEQQFEAAKDYRESLEIYTEDQLPEYEKKLAERAKKRAESEADGETKTGDGDSGDGAASGRGRSRVAGDLATADDSESERTVAAATSGDAVAEVEGEPTQPIPRRRGRGGTPGRRGGAAPGGAGSGGGDDAEIKKPREPRANRSAEVLLRAIDGELPVRVVAHRSSDILNALELAEKYNLNMTIEGGHEAALVADALAAADVKVVLGPAMGSGPYDGPRHRRFQPETPARLDAAGVDWVVGSGSAAGSRFVLMNAQVLAAHAPDADPLTLVTRDAARFLGLDAHGVVRSGAAADFVLWSADPTAPDARVVAVVVNGDVVYGALPE